MEAGQMEKKAETAYAIHDLLADRWSPVAFEPRPIPDESLGSLLEAARWAPSCFNDQPWFFLVARRQNEEEYQRMLECLVEGNRAWAQNASVLMITATRTTFRRNQKPNRFAPHDLGLAVGGLLVQASAMGLTVHQMGGFDSSKAREVYGVPEEFELQTAIAIGYRDDPSTLSENLRIREMQSRERKPLSSFVFSGGWDSPAGF
jgi:nitroreductase